MKEYASLKTRREFLRDSVVGGALTWTVPAFLARTFGSMHVQAASASGAPTGKDGTILIVLQMAGGNDGLNTVVPHSNDYYAAARPRLALPPNKVLKLNSEFGLHPALAGFRRLYDQGQLGIIHGVGYPNPNRSHFRSTEIWQTASDSNKFEQHGWIGRYFDHACAGCDASVGLNIGRQMPQAFTAKHPLGVSLENPQSYRFVASERGEDGEMAASEKSYRKLNRAEMDIEDDASENSGASIGAVGGATVVPGSALDFLERTALDAQVSSDTILAISRKVQNQATYPNSRLATSLQLIARLIGGHMPTRIYYVSQGGYDTHTNQPGAHDRLLQELGDSVKAFIDDMRAQKNLERVVLLTFSEFGRRVAENANSGTDHGAAAPLFVIGQKVKAGLLGKHPSLAPGDLLNGDLKFTTDFRSVYAGVLESWLRTPSTPILGRPFPPLVCV